MRFYSFKTRLIVLFAVLFIMGTIFTITGSIENAAAENAEMDFNYMSEYEFKDGMYVKGRVYEIYGEFAVEETYEKTFGITTNKRISSHYYVVPMIGTFESDTPMYVAVEISHVGMVEEAEKLMSQTWNYYDYDIDPGIWNEFDIQGKVTAMDGKLLDYFYEWFMYGDSGATRAEYEQYICPYLITYRNTSSSTPVFTVVLAAIGAIGLTVMLMLHFKNNSAPRNTYNQFSYSNESGNIPPYSPEAANEMTERGFPPVQPVKQNGPDIDDFFNNGERYRIPTAAPADSQNASMPSVSADSPAESAVNTADKTEESEEGAERDWWAAD